MDSEAEIFMRKPIVVGVDGSTSALEAAAWAAVEADRRGSQLQVLMCLDQRRAGATTADQHALHEASEVVRNMSPPTRVTVMARPGLPAPTLIDMSAQAGLIVVGATGSGSSSSLLPGRTALRVATWSHCSVVIVNKSAPATGMPANLLVVSLVDNSEASAIPLALAFEEAALYGAGLLVVAEPAPHGGPPTWLDPGDDGRPALLDALQTRFPHVSLRFGLLNDGSLASFIKADEAAGLVVLGTHSSAGLAPTFLDTTLHSLLCDVGCPVLVAQTRAPLNPRPPRSAPTRPPVLTGAHRDQSPASGTGVQPMKAWIVEAPAPHRHVAAAPR